MISNFKVTFGVSENELIKLVDLALEKGLAQIQPANKLCISNPGSVLIG